MQAGTRTRMVRATWTGSRYCFFSSGLSFLSSLALSSLVLSSLLLSSFAFSSIDSSSTSKIRVALGPISAPAPRSPYARLEGTKSCHFDPTGIICSLFHFFLLLFLNLRLYLLEHGLRFLLRQTRLATGHRVFQSLGYESRVYLHRLLFQVGSKPCPDIHSQCVAELLFSCCKCWRRRAFRRRSRFLHGRLRGCGRFRSCGCRSRWSRCRRSACWWGLLGIAIPDQHHPGGQ